MHCCIVSCVMSLHCIPARNNRVLGYCNGKVSRIPCFQAVETYCLKIFINICLLLSPSDLIDKSYFVPTYAVSFSFRKSLPDAPYISRGSVLQGAFRILRAPSVCFREILRIIPSSPDNIMFKRTSFSLQQSNGKLCFETPGIIRAPRNSSPQARTALYSEVVS